MNNSEPIAALEIGTTNTVIAIGEPLGGGRVKVAAINSIPSSGVRKSEINDMQKARMSIESVLRRLADKSDYSIGQAYLAVTGPHVRSTPTASQTPVDGGVVKDETIAEVNDRSYETDLARDRYAIELSHICYQLDDMDNIPSPKGMSGRLLTLRSLCIHGSQQHISNARNAAAAAKLEIPEDGVFFAGTCAAAAVLTKQEKRDGALVIDLGGGSTSYTAWAGGKMLLADVIGVGGDHVTEDIRIAFSLMAKQAESLKLSASAMISPDDAANRVPVPDLTPGYQPRTVSRRALNTVVNARLQELFTIVRSKLDMADMLHMLNAGVVLTGGASALPGTAELAASVFGCGVRVGSLVPEIEGLESHPHPAACAVVAGLLLLAQRQNEPEPSFFASIKNLFGRSK